MIEGARRGFRAHGIELNYWLVLYSRLAAARTKMGAAGGQATFSRQDLWKADLSGYDDIVIFGGGDLVRLQFLLL